MIRVTTIFLLGALLLGGCRGMESDRAPIRPHMNMVFQERFDAQAPNPFFEDGRAMRPPVPGTVARGLLREDDAFYYGRTEEGEYVEEIPIPVTREVLLRGRERYNIYCQVCHGQSGGGEGIIMTGGYGFTPAPSFHDDRLREVSNGYLYDVIANGVRNMPPYGHQIPVADRWAITAYIRALQRSQHATEEDVPPSIRAEIARMAGGSGGQQQEEASPEAPEEPEPDQEPEEPGTDPDAR